MSVVQRKPGRWQLASSYLVKGLLQAGSGVIGGVGGVEVGVLCALLSGVGADLVANVVKTYLTSLSKEERESLSEELTQTEESSIEAVVESQVDRYADAHPEAKAAFAAQPKAKKVLQSIVIETMKGLTAAATEGVESSLKGNDLLKQIVPRFVPGQVIDGEWELVERLGKGGFGEVWKAKHPEDESIKAALKFCLNEEVLHVLSHEGKIWSQLEKMGARMHDGIVQLQGQRLKNTPAYLIYTLVEGEDLRDWLRKVGQDARISEAQDIMEDLLAIIEFAHDKGIIHRDIKPSNILRYQVPGKAQRSGQTHRLKVIDFGIGAALARHPGLPGAHTKPYAPAEQVEGKEEARKTDDVYGLGVIWYQLLVGKLKLGKELSDHWQRELKTLNVRHDFIELIGTCLSERPEDRPANAGEIRKRWLEIPNPDRWAAGHAVDSVNVIQVLREPISHITASGNGRIVACASGNRAFLVDVIAGKTVRTFPEQLAPVVGLCFGQQGDQLTVVTKDGSVLTWDVVSSHPRVQFKIPAREVRKVAFCSSGKWLICNCYQVRFYDVSIWDAETGRCLGCLEDPLLGASVAISSDGLTAILGGWNGTLEIRRRIETWFRRRFSWFSSGKPEWKRLKTLSAHRSVVAAAAIQDDGETVVSASSCREYTLYDSTRNYSAGSDNSIKVWRKRGTEEGASFLNLDRGISQLVVSSNGRYVAAVSEEGLLRVWNTEKEIEYRCFGEKMNVQSVAFMLGTRRIVSGSEHGRLVVWELIE